MDYLVTFLAPFQTLNKLCLIIERVNVISTHNRCNGPPWGLNILGPFSVEKTSKMRDNLKNEKKLKICNFSRQKLKLNQ